MPSSIVVSASLTFGPVLELGDDQRDGVRRRRLDRSRGAVRRRWRARSAWRPARRRRPSRRPGYGATTVMTGNSMSGRSSCLRLPHAEMPAMNRAPASSRVTLRLATANWVRRFTIGSPRCAMVGGGRTPRPATARHPGSTGRARRSARSAASMRASISRSRREFSSRNRSRSRAAVRGRADDDLAAIRRVVGASSRPSSTSRSDLARSRSSWSRRRRCGELGHAHRPGREDQVQALVCDMVISSVVEFGRVRRHQAMHQRVERRPRRARGRPRPAVDGSLSSIGMFGISVLVRVLPQTISDEPTDLGSVPSYHPPVTLRSDRPRDRAPVPRRPPPAGAAARAAAPSPRPCGPWSSGSGQPPVRPARDHGAQPRPRPRGADRRLPAGLDRRSAVPRPMAVRGVQQGPLHRADGRAAVVPRRAGTASAPATPRPRSSNTPISSRSCSSASGRAGRSSSTDIEPRGAIDWYWRPTNQVRADPRGARRGRRPGASRGGTATGGSTTSWSASSRPTLLAETPVRRRPAPAQAPVALPRARPAGPAGGQQEVWLGTGQTAAERYRHRDALIADGLLLPVDVEGVRGDPVDARRRDGDARRGRALGRRRRRRSVDGSAPGVAFLAPAGPAGLGSRPAPVALRLRLRLGGLRPGREATVGLLRPAAAVSATDSSAASSRAFDRAAGALRVIDVWWEDGFDPLGDVAATDGSSGGRFVDAFVDALVAHARFGGRRADRLAQGGPSSVARSGGPGPAAARRRDRA